MLMIFAGRRIAQLMSLEKLRASGKLCCKFGDRRRTYSCCGREYEYKSL